MIYINAYVCTIGTCQFDVYSYIASTLKLLTRGSWAINNPLILLGSMLYSFTFTQAHVRQRARIHINKISFTVELVALFF